MNNIIQLQIYVPLYPLYIMNLTLIIASALIAIAFYTLKVAFHYSIPTRPNPTSLKMVEDLVADLVYD